MKMTKKGAIPAAKEDVWIGKCDYCKSEYEAEESELRYESSPSFIEDKMFAFCKLCKRIVCFKKLVMRGVQL